VADAAVAVVVLAVVASLAFASAQPARESVASVRARIKAGIFLFNIILDFLLVGLRWL